MLLIFFSFWICVFQGISTTATIIIKMPFQQLPSLRLCPLLESVAYLPLYPTLIGNAFKFWIIMTLPHEWNWEKKSAIISIFVILCFCKYKLIHVNEIERKNFFSWIKLERNLKIKMKCLFCDNFFFARTNYSDLP